jgi:rhodanese-related sulfurtransferase
MILLTMTGFDPTQFTATTSDVFDFADSDLLKSQNKGLYPYHYVSKAALTGLTVGYADGTFRPFDRIARQQAIAMAVRAGGSHLETPPEGWGGLFSYSDPTHGENVRIAEFNGLLDRLEGPSAYWDTTQDATRGECAQILWNLASCLAEPSTYVTVDVQTAYEQLSSDPHSQLVDVRERAEWAATGVPQGALLIPLAELEGRAPAELALDRPVYVICRSGVRSRLAAEILVRLGFPEVYNVDGGILAWLEAELPVRPYRRIAPDTGGWDEPCG